MNKIIKRKNIIIFVLMLAILSVFVFIYFSDKIKKEEPVPTVFPREKTMAEILSDLTAPAGEKIQISKETIKNLTAPKKTSVKVPEEVIKSLTAPAK